MCNYRTKSHYVLSGEIFCPNSLKSSDSSTHAMIIHLVQLCSIICSSCLLKNFVIRIFMQPFSNWFPSWSCLLRIVVFLWPRLFCRIVREFWWDAFVNLDLSLSMVDLQHMIAFTFCIWPSIFNSFTDAQYGKDKIFLPLCSLINDNFLFLKWCFCWLLSSTTILGKLGMKCKFINCQLQIKTFDKNGLKFVMHSSHFYLTINSTYIEAKYISYNKLPTSIGLTCSYCTIELHRILSFHSFSRLE